MPALRVARALWIHRRLFVELVKRDVRSRYAGSRFGLVWSFVNPLVQLASYGLIFGYVYTPANASDRGVFLASLFCGLWSWWAFQEATMRGLSSLVDQAHLLKRAPLPVELCVVSAAAGSFLLQSLGFLLFLAVFSVSGVVGVSSNILWLPVALLLGFALTSGAALVLAPVQLVVRDTVNVVNAALLLGFFASPVLYRVDSLPVRMQRIALLNPLSGLIGMYRLAVLGIPLDSATPVFLCVGVALAAWTAGAVLLGRLEGFLDEYW
jgi:ABC-type polysaccharide/polyol phosphate export permease